MIVVEGSHAHVMKFLPLHTNVVLMWCELSNSVNCVNGVYSLTHIILIIFIWSGNQLGLQSFIMTLYIREVFFIDKTIHDLIPCVAVAFYPIC
jgi:hypothetical protein